MEKKNAALLIIFFHLILFLDAKHPSLTIFKLDTKKIWQNGFTFTKRSIDFTKWKRQKPLAEATQPKQFNDKVK